MMVHILRVLMLGAVFLVLVGARPADDFDTFIQMHMARRQIVGLSLAIIHEGRVVDARAYGTTTRNGKVPVTTNTLFQAGSVSKAVAAFGALRLVESNKLSLTEDVNEKLKSWRVPDNEFTATERVTLKRLLSHWAGLTVRGFAGYEVTERIPSIPEILDGKGNSPAVRVDVVPGTINRYSGGGYTVMQQLLSDVSGKPFAEYMNDAVLKPLGMTNSTFQQPLSTALAQRTATGYLSDRSEVPGRWHVYPEMAAAGLWTTPTDLAKYAIGVQQAVAGKSSLLSADMARQMLNDFKSGQGLGPGVSGSGRTARFSHRGRDRGFDALLIAYAQPGDGVVVMINGNDNTGLMQGNRIVDFVAKQYKWPGWVDNDIPERVTPVDVPAETATALSGRYEFQNNNMVALDLYKGRVYTYRDGLPDEEFVMTRDSRFVSSETGNSFKLLRSASREVEGLEWVSGDRATRRIPRIGPLFTATVPQTDPDPTFTRNVLTVVHALAEGGRRTAELPVLTPSARKQFTEPVAILKAVRALAFMHESDVAGRGIERLGHPIQRVLHYRMDIEQGHRWLLVHVDPNGLVADFDVVDN